MGNMLVLPQISHLVEYQRDVMQGTWKFRPKTAGFPGLSFHQIAEIGRDLQIENPGGGKFLHLSIIEAGENEYGLCMTYLMSKAEASHSTDGDMDGHFLDKYIDFFMRHAGLAYKGYEVFRSHVVNVNPPSQEELDQVA